MRAGATDRADDARRLVEAWAAPTPEQAGLRDRFATHLREHPDGLDRTCRPAHLTAGAIVLSPALDLVLLTLHKRARRWFQLGGHVEPGDATLADAAAREAAEESGLTGLRLDPVPLQLSEHSVEFCGAPGTVQHLDVRFLAVATGAVVPVVSEESLAVRWWPVGALPDTERELAELVSLGVARAQAGSTSTSPSSPGGGSSLAAAE